MYKGFLNPKALKSKTPTVKTATSRPLLLFDNKKEDKKNSAVDKSKQKIIIGGSEIGPMAIRLSGFVKNINTNKNRNDKADK